MLVSDRAVSRPVAQSSGSEHALRRTVWRRVRPEIAATGLTQLATTTDLTATGAVAYDDDLYARRCGIGSRVIRVDQWVFTTMLTANADYDWRGRRDAGRRDRRLGAPLLLGSRQEVRTVSYTARPRVLYGSSPRRTTLFANQTVAYSPSYLYGLVSGLRRRAPETLPPPAPDYFAYDTESLHPTYERPR